MCRIGLFMVRSGFSSWLLLSLAFALCLGRGNMLYAQAQLSPIHYDNNTLHYTPDSAGNRIPDFSYSGYMAGKVAIPFVEVKALVRHQTEDATTTIQSAIDYVAKLPLNRNGFRGAILLEKGTYQIAGNLVIPASGIVLRGSGSTDDGTLLIGTGTTRETLVRVAGVMDSMHRHTAKVTTDYVPVNAVTFEVTSGAAFKVGDEITIHRASSASWIQALGADHFGGGITALGWKPGQRDIYWDRTITKIEGNNIHIDAPITTALDRAYGQTTIISYSQTGRIGNVGVENLRLQSTYDTANPKDEAHRWMAITLEQVQDAWVRQVNFTHFAGSAVYVAETGRRITVEDCKSLAPVAEIGGQRRYSFFTNGQQTLFQRLYAEYGYHDFAVGFMAAGPNAFVQCHANQPFSYSGAIDSWSSGTLFDGVEIDGQALRFANLGQDGNGAGWAAANSVFWQCSAAKVECDQPPTAQNWAFGTWAQFSGNAYWEKSNEHIKPQSLYYAQLAQRLGNEKVEKRTFLMPLATEASSSPSVAVAEELSSLARTPVLTLFDFIDQAKDREQIDLAADDAKVFNRSATERSEKNAKANIQLINGWLVGKMGVLTGKTLDVQWWSGSARKYGLAQARPHITRFVPGRIGHGLTDDLAAVIDTLKKKQVIAFEHNYGLWYDRRRDDHQRVRRMDGDVWPPFYELPFARSGKDKAWDGLSKYDLTKYNHWYWSRLKEFARLAEQQDILLIHQQYFQHHILEAGAHYADFPWRTANNINHTNFPEPPPYAGNKRIFMDEQFYDVSEPNYRALHESYVHQCLENFENNSGVLQLIGAEFTGPLSFVAWWLEVIGKWKQGNSGGGLIGLSTTKDVQDAILENAANSQWIDVIDIRYWYEQSDGRLYAPKGGEHLAPRQQARLFKPQKTSFEKVYQAVFTYKKRFPKKAVIYSANDAGRYGWAVFMAGGSLAALPEALPEGFLLDARQMQPIVASPAAKEQYTLMAKDGTAIYYVASNSQAIEIDLTKNKKTFKIAWINPDTGKMLKELDYRGGKKIKLPTKGSDVVLWLHTV